MLPAPWGHRFCTRWLARNGNRSRHVCRETALADLLPPTRITGLLDLTTFERQAVLVGGHKLDRPLRDKGMWWRWLHSELTEPETQREEVDQKAPQLAQGGFWRGRLGSSTLDQNQGCGVGRSGTRHPLSTFGVVSSTRRISKMSPGPHGQLPQNLALWQPSTRLRGTRHEVGAGLDWGTPEWVLVNLIYAYTGQTGGPVRFDAPTSPGQDDGGSLAVSSGQPESGEILSSPQPECQSDVFPNVEIPPFVAPK